MLWRLLSMGERRTVESVPLGDGPEEPTVACEGALILTEDSHPAIEPVLRELGVQVAVTARLEDALAQLVRHRPRVVFADWELPLDAMVLCNAVRKSVGSLAPRVVLLVDSASPELQELALSLGAGTVVGKRAAAEELRECLASLF